MWKGDAFELLFRTTFPEWRSSTGNSGKVRKAHTPGFEEYFQRVFFHNPWVDSSSEPLVCAEDHRGVVGFLGIVPRPMSMNGKSIQAAFGSSHVVHPESRSTLAGLKLLAAFMDGKQDLVMADTANRLTQRLWAVVGGSSSAAYGMKWVPLLRPGLYALHMMSRPGKSGLSGACGHACQILSKTMEAAATRSSLGRLRRAPNGITEEDLEVDTLLRSCLLDSSAPYSLRPEYNRESLSWLLDFMTQMKAYGNLRRVALRDATRRLIGWFIYYVKRGGISEVVQMGAAKDHTKTVIEYLFRDARNRGAIGAHGRLEIRHAQELFEARCFFWGTTPFLFRARAPELARLVQQGRAFLSRLDGEWCLKYGAREHERVREKASSEATDRLVPGNIQASPPLQTKAAK